MTVWWVGRRDAALVRIAERMVFFGGEPVEDPGAAELADALADLAVEYVASARGDAVRRAGAFLEEAAGELRRADRFRGTLLPVVLRHLRRAEVVLDEAGGCLGTAVRGPLSPAAGVADRGAGSGVVSRGE
ncbi:hypothetical protein GCM10010495_81800 [Kitasatospora herbaricolor]|uniref:hypothetical protein n=1 Tax=Kitasatospora herbaricolor TaxID=68217 RepID=UPI0017498EDF|nr:hypothetical protein [Kitasatospora herbaricolor]MDQ0313311.1 hypothetical protein [Kitasatospora herbaricolor]GGV52061.1 hypothetical protein GCM10010495_81800 [Kitasatospora herbaricolor]